MLSKYGIVMCSVCGRPAAWNKCELCGSCYSRKYRLERGWRPKEHPRQGLIMIPPMLHHMMKLWDAIHKCVAPARIRIRMKDELNLLCQAYPDVANTSKFKVPWRQPYTPE